MKLRIGSVGNWVAVIGAVGVGAALAMSAQGCTVTTNTNPDGGVFGDDDDGGFNPNDSGDTTHPDGSVGDDDGGGSTVDPCNECIYGTCESQWNTCMPDSNCHAIYECAIAPTCITDANCVQACYDAPATASGQNAYAALAACDVQSECDTCGSICGTSNAAVCSFDAGPQDPDAATPNGCNTCTASSCASELEACAPTTECDVFTQCVANCADTACIDACGTAHAQGKTDATALGTCTQTSCASACAL